MDLLTQSEENYLKAIYHLQSFLDGPVGTNELANKLNTKASSVTDMVRRLSEKSYIAYTPYKGCEITDKGRKIALKTIRKHRLWETFLVNTLNFGWEEVHEIAEQLEHIQSVKLTDRLDEFLNFPKFDPHGDPIPNSKGEITQREETRKLSELEIERKGRVIGVSDSSSSFLSYLDKYLIKLGSIIEIKDRFDFDKSMEVVIDGNRLNISLSAANKISVEQI